jgi:hypothetical protein
MFHDYLFFYDTKMTVGKVFSYPLKTGYSGIGEKSWKKGSDNGVALLFICKMRVKDYFTV